jgi:2-haloacid dehalogenase
MAEQVPQHQSQQPSIGSCDRKPITEREPTLTLNPLNTHYKPPALVFDFGGVIFDWNPYYLYRRFFNNDRKAVELFLEEIKLKEWNFLLDEGAPFSETVKAAALRYPQYRELICAFDTCWVETMGGVLQPTVDLLAELNAQTAPLYALSNWSAETFPRIRQDYPFLNWFQDIVLSGEEKACKPDSKLFHRFLARTHLNVQDCLFIDDSALNVEAAANLGFDAILFLSASQLREEIIKRGWLRPEIPS